MAPDSYRAALATEAHAAGGKVGPTQITCRLNLSGLVVFLHFRGAIQWQKCGHWPELHQENTCSIRPGPCGNACSAQRRGRFFRIWGSVLISWPIWPWFAVGIPCFIAPVTCVLSDGKLRTVVGATGFDNRVLPLRTCLRTLKVHFPLWVWQIMTPRPYRCGVD